MDVAALKCRYEAELAALEGEPVALTLDVSTLLIIVGAIQLALRHPELPRLSSTILLEFIEKVAEGLDQGQNGAISEVINRGFNPVYDDSMSEGEEDW